MPRLPLPQLHRLFLTDGGLETDLIFHHGVDLPCFAAFTLLASEEGQRRLEAYYRRYLDIARDEGLGFVLESASWRASSDWAARLAIPLDELDRLNRLAIVMLIALRDEYQSDALPIVISGCLGPRGDGYDPGKVMSVDDAEAYHERQANVLAQAGADMLSGITMTNVSEAAGLVRAARRVALPVAISFTLETDGRLPTGDALGEAIEKVDAETEGYAAYFMINCAHPSHFGAALAQGESWIGRLGGLRANASRRSHAELEAMSELDDGDPEELGRDYAQLRAQHPQLRVLGGCCGTDHRHVAAIARSAADKAFRVFSAS